MESFIVEKLPSKTYRMDMEKGRITGLTDGKEAIKQAVYKAVNTERFRYPIYSYQYGAELADLFGHSRDYVYTELERRITEALLTDDRIEEVKDFVFAFDRNTVHVTFTVVSVFGSFEGESEVNF